VVVAVVVCAGSWWWSLRASWAPGCCPATAGVCCCDREDDAGLSGAGTEAGVGARPGCEALAAGPSPGPGAGPGWDVPAGGGQVLLMKGGAVAAAACEPGWPDGEGASDVLGQGHPGWLWAMQRPAAVAAVGRRVIAAAPAGTLLPALLFGGWLAGGAALLRPGCEH
jgi:hypothetical protein